MKHFTFSWNTAARRFSIKWIPSIVSIASTHGLTCARLQAKPLEYMILTLWLRLMMEITANYLIYACTQHQLHWMRQFQFQFHFNFKSISSRFIQQCNHNYNSLKGLNLLRFALQTFNAKKHISMEWKVRMISLTKKMLFRQISFGWEIIIKKNNGYHLAQVVIYCLR